GIVQGVYLVGDVMYEALLWAAERARAQSAILEQLGVQEKGYLLATVHRAENTDDPVRLRAILDAFATLDEPIVFPVHPRTRNRIETLKLKSNIPNLKSIEPVGYLDMVQLEQSARMILTDSGGIQKEAYWLGAPCVTLRDETEWVETVQAGWNLLAGAETARIVAAVRNFVLPEEHPTLYGDGQVAERIGLCLQDLHSAVIS
ncbi:MAG: UDP-N-acetylglucosamine 2-epimerase, partial [Anaerolineae bacterium]|nr:UDP-N-acetylglucosamine 2-epimerase [Anaerolineae bacterium]